MLMHPEDMVDTSSEGVHRVETSNYAFFMESTSIEYMTNRYCDLSMYGGLLNEKGYGIAARHGSPYLPALSRAILKLGVSGKLAALKRKWWEKKHGGTTCNHEEPEDIIGPIDLLHISGLVYITSFGVTLAVLSAILEFSIHTYRLSRILKVPLFRTFKHEIKTCFGGNVKRVIDPTLLSRSTPEDTRTETIRELEIIKDHPRLIKYRDSYNGHWNSAMVMDKKPKMLKDMEAKNEFFLPDPLYQGFIPISKKKFDSLQCLKKFCGQESQDYFSNITHLSQ
ncbi:hypothetical protein NQ314_020149 [Rhamnusium bicolor]|uniref:Ionotropic glutamate receptor C-terminal domain-containing protein n=1 Tax=Rhamnusium bicolor TaxID=1586634 RepID=A0AAV8WLI9_9CUCU|nr:hypothetical protein NQ314_020149 [Rhamnusium bicolor]